MFYSFIEHFDILKLVFTSMDMFEVIPIKFENIKQIVKQAMNLSERVNWIHKENATQSAYWMNINRE